MENENGVENNKKKRKKTHVKSLPNDPLNVKLEDTPESLIEKRRKIILNQKRNRKKNLKKNEKRRKRRMNANLETSSEINSSNDHVHRNESNSSQLDLDLKELCTCISTYESLSIEKAKKENNIISLNRLISEFGKKKKLGCALETFFQMNSIGLKGTAYTFTNLINACVRCGEIEIAKEFLKRMVTLKVAPNAVTYTALLKGLCQEGLLKEAVCLLEQMKNENIQPNLRTFNTILRGCLRCGKYKIAMRIFQEMQMARIEPDIYSYEYLIRSLCQALKLDKALFFQSEMEKRGIRHAPIYASIATACAILGRKADSEEAIKLAETLLETGENDIDCEEASNDKRRFRASLPLFLRLRKEEVERECARVKDYWKRFSMEEKPLSVDFRLFPKSERVLFLAKSATGRRDMKECFPRKNRPLRLEVCSGHGDWIIGKAIHDQRSNWVALEMRYERVFQIWSKLFFNGLQNLLILAGEAHAIFRESIADDTIDEIFINFPDPPVWQGSKQRLIDQVFLHELYRVLRDDASVTILTDDETFSQQIAKEFALLSNRFESMVGDDVENYSEHVPEDYGISSYFDRFWKNGNKIRRFFFRFIKRRNG